jgi:tetratricopeptide (TPR) repeat protein
MIRRMLLLLVAAAVLLPAVGTAQIPGTMFGLILDENEEPIPGVKIVVTDPESEPFRLEEVTDDRGRYTLFLPSSLPSYTLDLSKEGYVPRTLQGIKVQARKRTRGNLRMTSIEAAQAAAPPPSADAPPPEEAGGGYLKLYNDGVAAMDAGDLATAKMRFQESLEKKPDYGLAHGALARVYWKQEDWEPARSHGEKSLELNPADTEINQVLYAAYNGLGDKKKAKEVLDRMQSANPEKAGKNMFNQGADLFNGGQIAEAKEIFQQILEVDPDQAKAHYMLGMFFVNEGANEDAKRHFSRFLELAPNDPDASLAREMLEYL